MWNPKFFCDNFICMITWKVLKRAHYYDSRMAKNVKESLFKRTNFKNKQTFKIKLVLHEFELAKYEIRKNLLTHCDSLFNKQKILVLEQK